MTIVNHPCIVRCYGMLEPSPGIVLELVEGNSLFQIIHGERGESFMQVPRPAPGRAAEGAERRRRRARERLGRKGGGCVCVRVSVRLFVCESERDSARVRACVRDRDRAAK